MDTHNQLFHSAPDLVRGSFTHSTGHSVHMCMSAHKEEEIISSVEKTSANEFVGEGIVTL